LDELLKSINWVLAGWANYFRHGVSKATFQAINHHTWWRIVRWISRKHHRMSVKEIVRRFCDGGWMPVSNGVRFTGTASVSVTRYRYRGRNIPTPWNTPNPAATS